MNSGGGLRHPRQISLLLARASPLAERHPNIGWAR